MRISVSQSGRETSRSFTEEMLQEMVSEIVLLLFGPRAFWSPDILVPGDGVVGSFPHWASASCIFLRTPVFFRLVKSTPAIMAPAAVEMKNGMM